MVLINNNCDFTFTLKRDDNNGKIYNDGLDIQFLAPEKNDIVWFLYFDRINLKNASFPVLLNGTNEEVIPKYALLYYKEEEGKYHRIVTKDIATVGALSKGKETVPSHNVLCWKINKQIQTYLKTLQEETKKELYKHLYVPFFDVIDDQLICTYKYFEGNATEDLPCVIGFDFSIFNLIGKHFNCEFGKNEDEKIQDNEKYYYVYPFIDEIEKYTKAYKHETDRIIYARYQVDDFFHPEHELIIEFTRNTNTQFTGQEASYVKNVITFRDKEEIVEINKYILFANGTTIKESNPSNHNLRCSVEFDTDFNCNSNLSIIVKGDLISQKDVYDQFTQFNLHIGSMYTAEQYQQLSFRKLIGLTTDNVYVQNQESAEQLKKIVETIQATFVPMGDKEEDNVTLVLHRIYDILCQSQEITNLGPPVRQKIKLGIEF